MNACGRHPFLISLLSCICWVGSGIEVAAQAADDQSALPSRAIESRAPLLLVDVAVSPDQLRELSRWIDDFTAWKRWNAEWRNRVEPGYFRLRERRPRPQPPEWLFSRCADAPEDDSRLDQACRLLLEWSDNDPTAAARRREAADAVAREEPPAKNVWWQHVHLDTLWVMPQSGSSIYGVVGVHATIDLAGRLQVFVAPGAMLINLPREDGGRQWTAATHWGFAFRLFDFKLPGTDRPATLHANIVKARILTGPTVFGESTLDLVGFSITMKRR